MKLRDAHLEVENLSMGKDEEEQAWKLNSQDKQPQP